MAVVETRPQAAAAPATGIADLSGPRRITDPLEAVLASIIPAEPLPRFEVSVANDGRHATGYVNGFELWSIAVPRDRWLETLTGQIVATIAMLLRRLVFVHAGVVEVGGRGCMLVGDSGAGKTSTVAALVTRGAAYLSDEVALLEPDTNHMVPFHLPMAVKRWTARAAGRLPAGTDVARQNTVVFRLPARLGGPCPLGTAILLEREGRAGIKEISRAEALVRLSRQPSSFQYAGRTEDAFRAWVQGLRTARCFLINGERPAALAPTLMRTLEGGV